MDLGSPARFIIAFVVVLGLIVLTAWLIKRLSGAGGYGHGWVRGKEHRIEVIDATAVDAKRRLVLVRRDETNHLVLIGGPQDVVIETGIPHREFRPQEDAAPLGVTPPPSEAPETAQRSPLSQRLSPKSLRAGFAERRAARAASADAPSDAAPEPAAPQPEPPVRQTEPAVRPSGPATEAPAPTAAQRQPAPAPRRDISGDRPQIRTPTPPPAAPRAPQPGQPAPARPASAPPPQPPRPTPSPRPAEPAQKPVVGQPEAPLRNDPVFDDMSKRLEAVLNPLAEDETTTPAPASPPRKPPAPPQPPKGGTDGA